MILLMTACLIAITLYTFRASGGEWLSPGVVVGSVFSLSSLAACGLVFVWEVRFSFLGALTIVGSVALFCVADLASRRVLGRRRPQLLRNPPLERYTPSRKMLAAVLVVQLVAFAAVMMDSYRISLIGGNPGGLVQMWSTLNHAIAYGLAEFSSLTKLSLLLSQALAVVSTVGLVGAALRRGSIRGLVIFALPMVLYMATVAVTSDRLGIVHATVSIVVIVAAFATKLGFKAIRGKTLLLGGAAMAGFLLLFYGLGLLTGKTQVMGGLALPTYIGSSILGMADYVANYSHWTGRSYFGANTLQNIYEKLALFGLHVPPVESWLEFRTYGNSEFSANLYTALRRYLQDYTFFGLVIILIGLAVLYRYFLMRALSAERSQYTWIAMLAVFYYPLFEFSIEERFFTRLVGLGSIIMVIIVLVVGKVVFEGWRLNNFIEVVRPRRVEKDAENE